MDLLLKLTPECVVLTPNRRLSASLLKKHAALQIATGKTSWTTPTLLPISTWLETLWQQYTLDKFSSHPFILDSNQEQFVWESLVKQSEENNALLQVDSTAELAKSALTILKQWQVKPEDLEDNENSIIFKKWAARFDAVCAKRNFIDKNSLVQIIIEKIYTGEIYLPKELILYGFAEISPLYQSLLAACKNANTKIASYQPENTNQKTSRIQLRDEETEIYAMARFAKARHKENSEHMIGCVVHNLEKLRDKVLRIFSEVFCEEGTFTLSHIELPFNISAGKPLSQYPVIYAALQYLQLSKKTILFSQWSFLLRSPFLGGAEKEIFTRTRLERTLRRKNLMTCSLPPFLQLIDHASCPLLHQHLQAFLNLNSQIQTEQYASEWVAVIVELLQALGWPGDRSLTSPEYQVTQEWLHVLEEFSGLDHIMGKLSFNSALDYLTRLLNNRIFQIESPDRNIQILGMLEAADMPFDHLWVMGLDDSVWPPMPKPNPYIPYALQRDAQMPHATATRELVYCEELITQLRRSTKEVIFSYAQQKEEGELRPSPLITAFIEISETDLKLSAFKETVLQVFETRQTDDVEDNLAPAISHLENVRGGTSIFKLQAACPFRAFAEIRLQAKHPDDLTLGLSPAKRGEIMHKALEIIWSELKDQRSLLACRDDSALQKLITSSVEKALRLITKEKSSQLRYLTIESQRLEKLILEWLQIEKQRSDFKVHALESEIEVNFHGIPLKLRIDRIDEVGKDRHVIIDYKTSQHITEKAWLGERLDEPQLPLYCIIDPEKVAGIAFAQINPSQIEFKSLGPITNTTETEQANWSEQINQWQVDLEKLATDFKQGVALVDPKIPEQTCRHCHLHGLCRVYQPC